MIKPKARINLGLYTRGVRPVAPSCNGRPVKRVMTLNAAPTPSEQEEAMELDGSVTTASEEVAPQLSRWQRIGQSFNVAGIAFFAKMVLTDRSMAIPHLQIDDLRQVQWAALKKAGFEGCIFDKDNTLTEPYRLELRSSAAASLEECRAAFGKAKIVLYSNSAGLEQFDPEGVEAEELEEVLGIAVLRHKEKKPAGGPEDLERHFGCKAEKLIMIGDRFLTDVAFGNRLGMLTIRPEPFTSEGETTAVRAARAVEGAFVARCRSREILPPAHALVAGANTLASFLKELDDNIATR